jgi:hypothetical protein
MRKIPPTYAVTTAIKPACPDCVKDMLFDPTENMIRLGVHWGCKVHLMVATGRRDPLSPFGAQQTKPLGEMVGNRALRRQNMKRRPRVPAAQAK